MQNLNKCFFCGKTEEEVTISGFIDGKNGQTIYICENCNDQLDALIGNIELTQLTDEGIQLFLNPFGLELGVYYNPDYKKAYEILMEYWDSLPDEEKPKINERLKLDCGME